MVRKRRRRAGSVSADSDGKIGRGFRGAWVGAFFAVPWECRLRRTKRLRVDPSISISFLKSLAQLEIGVWEERGYRRTKKKVAADSQLAAGMPSPWRKARALVVAVAAVAWRRAHAAGRSYGVDAIGKWVEFRWFESRFFLNLGFAHVARCESENGWVRMANTENAKKKFWLRSTLGCARLKKGGGANCRYISTQPPPCAVTHT